MFPSCHAYTFIAMTQLVSQYFEVYELSALVFAHQDKQITGGLLDDGFIYPVLYSSQLVTVVTYEVARVDHEFQQLGTIPYVPVFLWQLNTQSVTQPAIRQNEVIEISFVFSHLSKFAAC